MKIKKLFLIVSCLSMQNLLFCGPPKAYECAYLDSLDLKSGFLPCSGARVQELAEFWHILWASLVFTSPALASPVWGHGDLQQCVWWDAPFREGVYIWFASFGVGVYIWFASLVSTRCWRCTLQNMIGWLAEDLGLYTWIYMFWLVCDTGGDSRVRQTT